MRILLVALLLVCAGSAFAGNPTSSPYRFGTKLISPNDPISKLIEIAGEPERKVPITNDYGVVKAWAWHYRDGQKNVIVYTNESTVNWIDPGN